MTSFSEYLNEIQANLQRGNATEHTHRPALKRLIESLGDNITATNDPKHVEFGAPDFDVSLNENTIGYIETKDIDDSLTQTEKSEQLQRYLRSIENLILTDYLDFRWYIGGELRAEARLGRVGKDGKITVDKEGQKKVKEISHGFLAHSPEPINNARELAERMARLTHMIRDIIVEAFNQNKPSDLLKGWREAFAQVLIADLDQPQNTGQFADMIAQTLAYGLFSAIAMDETPNDFSRHEAQTLIPKTNPFLRDFFEQITGNKLDEEPFIGFVDDLVQLLANADISAILAEFGKRTRRQDPIVHFYETFLATYDPALRERRGVYYTPEPVVSYIVRSVDYLLKERFGLTKGLSDTATVEYEYQDDGENKRATNPKVLVLDPAAGTATFLYAVIDLIRERFMQTDNAGMWSGFVRQHLLPRLFGFELLMAPYAIAHLKLGMQLAGQDLESEQRKRWHYDFASDDRLGIYLTNTLEQADDQIEGLFGPMRLVTKEASSANKVKQDLPIMVVIGNPPYFGQSSNRSWEEKVIPKGEKYFIDWQIDDNMRAKPVYKYAKSELKNLQPTFIGEIIRDYYISDGNWLGERNPKWLQDDYVKFIRWAQWRIEKTGHGILAFITNHGYLDNPTFRGMRQSLINSFSYIYILDLHGSTLKKEKTPAGGTDVNVFDIQPGVSIGIFVKENVKDEGAQVFHANLWGTRESKYKELMVTDVSKTEWEIIHPRSPFYLFSPLDTELLNEYENGILVTDIFPTNSVGIVTARDRFTIHWTEEDVWETINDFVELPPEVAREKYDLGRDVRDWKVKFAQADVKKSGPTRGMLSAIYYRPFDTRFTYYTGQSRGFMCMPRNEVMRNLVPSNQNLALITSRLTKGETFRHAQVSRNIVEVICMSSKTSNNGYVFPLYIYPEMDQYGKQKDLFNTSPWEQGIKGRTPNLSESSVKTLSKNLGLKFHSEGPGDLLKTFGPEDIFNYVYAILHSPTYRERYTEFLKIDFPRLPLTSDVKLFKKLVALGEQLVALHLLEAPQVAKSITSFPQRGESEIAARHPRYVPPGETAPGTGEKVEAGRVYINEGQYFEGVSPEVWEFQVGGYQVLDKWLEDRKGRKLNFDDLEHYQKIVVALNETIRIMGEIDMAIPEWPIQ